MTSRVCERGTSGHVAAHRGQSVQRGLFCWPCRLWAMPAHTSSTALTTTDDNLAVYDDAAGLRCAKRKTPSGLLCESFVHLRYIWVKKFGRTRASAARGCANAAPAAMPQPTEAREGCSGLVVRPVHATCHLPARRRRSGGNGDFSFGLFYVFECTQTCKKSL